MGIEDWKWGYGPAHELMKQQLARQADDAKAMRIGAADLSFDEPETVEVVCREPGWSAQIIGIGDGDGLVTGMPQPPPGIVVSIGDEFDRVPGMDAWRITCADGSTVTFPTEVFKAFAKQLVERGLIDDARKCEHGVDTRFAPCGGCAVKWSDEAPSGVARLPEKKGPDNSVAHLDVDLLCDDE